MSIDKDKNSQSEIEKIVIKTIEAMQNAIFAIPTDEFGDFSKPSLSINWDKKNNKLVLDAIRYYSWNTLCVYAHEICYYPEHDRPTTIYRKGYLDFASEKGVSNE